MKRRKLRRWIFVAGIMFFVVLTGGIAIGSVLVVKAGAYAYSQWKDLPLEQWNQKAAEATRELSSNQCTQQLLGLMNLEGLVKTPLTQTWNSIQSSCFPTPKADEPSSV